MPLSPGDIELLEDRSSDLLYFSASNPSIRSHLHAQRIAIGRLVTELIDIDVREDRTLHFSGPFPGHEGSVSTHGRWFIEDLWRSYNLIRWFFRSMNSVKAKADGGVYSDRVSASRSVSKPSFAPTHPLKPLHLK